MVKQYLLNEDNLPPKLPVIYSDEIRNEIEIIKEYNQFEKEGLAELFSYIKGIENHISNRAIAFNYGNKNTIDTEGTVIVKNMGVGFCLFNDSEKVFVKILWININLEDFRLEEVPPLYEDKQHITNGINQTIYLKESELKQMIEESVRNVLKEKMCQRLNESISWSLHRILREHISKTANTKW